MISNVLYLIASVCFILALKGLSSAETAIKGNLFGIFGMLAACVASYLTADYSEIAFTLVSIAIGAGIGIYIARSV